MCAVDVEYALGEIGRYGGDGERGNVRFGGERGKTQSKADARRRGEGADCDEAGELAAECLRQFLGGERRAAMGEARR